MQKYTMSGTAAYQYAREYGESLRIHDHSVQPIGWRDATADEVLELTGNTSYPPKDMRGFSKALDRLGVNISVPYERFVPRTVRALLLAEATDPEIARAVGPFDRGSHGDLDIVYFFEEWKVPYGTR